MRRRIALRLAVLIFGLGMAGSLHAEPVLIDTPEYDYRLKHYERAILWLIGPAASGVIEAQALLGHMYLMGEGTKPDRIKASLWLRTSADRGYRLAAYDLGVMLQQGTGVGRDYQSAAHYLRIAGTRQSTDAAFNLALMYHQGLGVDRDDLMALSWAQAAADNEKYPYGANIQKTGEVLASWKEIKSGLTAEQVGASLRILSPDAPLFRAAIRNERELEDPKSYPIGMRHLDWSGSVWLLVRVDQDGLDTIRRLRVQADIQSSTS